MTPEADRQVLEKGAELSGGGPALVHGNTVLTYETCVELAEYLSSFAKSKGIVRQSRTAVLCETSLPHLLLIHALLRTGAMYIPLSTRSPVNALEEDLMTCAAEFLVTGNSDFEPELFPLRSLELHRVLNIRPVLDCHADTRGLSLESRTGLFTSGSSGKQKCAVHPLSSHVCSAEGINGALGVTPSSRWLLTLPLYHAGGLAVVFRTALAGAVLVVPDRERSLPEQINQYEITHLSLVATQLKRLVDSGITHFPTLKSVLIGGSAVPPGLTAQAHKMGLPVYTSYGCTEMASTVTLTPSGGPLGPNTSGSPLPYRELRIGADDEIQVRGPCLASGYLSSCGLTPLAGEDGWYGTGDLGSLDGNGQLTVAGRRDNMFISGGENIHPEEIELALLELPEIESAMVVPLEHPEYGQRPAAFVKMKPGHAPDNDRLETLLRKSLAAFKVPDVFYPWPEGYTESGIKPSRKAFRVLAEKHAL